MTGEAARLYKAASEAPNARQRAHLTLLGNLASASTEPNDAIVWLYVGRGDMEPGAMRLGDLRALLEVADR